MRYKTIKAIRKCLRTVARIMFEIQPSFAVTTWSQAEMPNMLIVYIWSRDDNKMNLKEFSKVSVDNVTMPSLILPMLRYVIKNSKINKMIS